MGVSLVQPHKPPNSPVRPVCHVHPREHVASLSGVAAGASQNADNNIINAMTKTKKNSVDLQFGIGYTGDLLTDKRNCNCDVAVEFDGYQTTTALSNILGGSALIPFPVTNIDDDAPTIPHNFGLRVNAISIMVFILSPVRVMLKSAFNALVTMLTQISLTYHLLSSNQGRAVASTPRVRRYYCATQRRASSNTRLQIGVDNYIPRWVIDSIVKYVVCDESFDNSKIAEYVATSAAEAISMWQGIGVKFNRVNRSQAATFQIKYLDLPPNGDRSVYAEAFFPQDRPGTLFVYKLALNNANIEYLSNILAHEFGHILGIRHGFAGDPICKGSKITKEHGSVLWGSKNESSVMNYYTHSSMHVVNEQDRRELQSFYDYTEEKYEGLSIRDFQPNNIWFPIQEKRCTRWSWFWSVIYRVSYLTNE